jgi:hypothetical protein
MQQRQDRRSSSRRIALDPAGVRVGAHGDEMQRQVRERERPEPSVVWQTLGITFAGFGVATVLGTLTISDDAAVRPGELWVATAGFLLAAALCFLAHRDVNKGRRSRWVEVEELPAADEEQQKDPPTRV